MRMLVCRSTAAQEGEDHFLLELVPHLLNFCEEIVQHLTAPVLWECTSSVHDADDIGIDAMISARYQGN